MWITKPPHPWFKRLGKFVEQRLVESMVGYKIVVKTDLLKAMFVL